MNLREESKGDNVSTPEPNGQKFFDVSGIDWEDDTAIDQAAQLIWTIFATKGDNNQ